MTKRPKYQSPPISPRKAAIVYGALGLILFVGLKSAPKKEAPVLETAKVEETKPVTTTPEEVQKVATPTYEFGYDEAKEEMCEAGKQYFNDVLNGRGTLEQAKEEVRRYSTYLSRKSPAGASELRNIGMACSMLWS